MNMYEKLEKLEWVIDLYLDFQSSYYQFCKSNFPRYANRKKELEFAKKSWDEELPNLRKD